MVRSLEAERHLGLNCYLWVWPLFLIYKMGLGERLAYSVQAVEVDSHSSVPVAACRVGTNEDNLMTLLQFDHFH